MILCEDLRPLTARTLKTAQQSKWVVSVDDVRSKTHLRGQGADKISKTGVGAARDAAAVSLASQAPDRRNTRHKYERSTFRQSFGGRK